jgi:type I restriction enzyme R subunit
VLPSGIVIGSSKRRDQLIVPPISGHGKPGEIIKLFGGPDNLREAVNNLQVILYGS